MKFYISTLGCKVNTYESNMIKEELEKNNYQLSKVEDANIIIVNTCTVTNVADKKSLKEVRSLKRKNKDALFIVMGCSSQNKKERYIKEADIILGNQYKKDIVSLIEEEKRKKEQQIKVDSMQNLTFEPMMVHTFDHTRAYVKIQDGCNNYCSYCIIPFVRGNVRSKEVSDVIKEVEMLVKNGKQEIVLTGINTGYYQKENGSSLTSLLKELKKIEGLKRIRISSIEVTELDDEFLEELKQNEKIVSHLHIPLQSGCNKTLKKMNRKYTKEYFLEKLEKIRSIRSDISITTDVIVGFPEETEEDFIETKETIQNANFSKIHVFPYSKREGTFATSLKEVDEKVKKQRVKELLLLSSKLEKNYFSSFLGKTVEVLMEENNIGHTGNYLPIKVEAKENQMIQVQIKKLEYPYLIGEKLTENGKI